MLTVRSEIGPDRHPLPTRRTRTQRFVLVVVLVLEVRRSMGPVLVRPLRFAALFSLSPTIQD
jgi:hypothetical protein